MTKMKKILFVNHSGTQCGVYQYGWNVYGTLKNSSQFEMRYLEINQLKTLEDHIIKEPYWAVIYNYYPHTLNFITPAFIKKHPHVIHISLAHELPQEVADRLKDEFFDYYIMGDPTLTSNNPRVFKIGRIVPKYEKPNASPEIVTIGTFGFGTGIKQYHQLIDLVQQEFDRARIRIN